MLTWTTGNTLIPDPDILSACFSTDNGLTWTSKVTINSNARKDGGDDAFTGMKTDGLGNWVVTWSSNNILPGNTDNEDTDIHAATSTLTNGDNIIVLTPDGGEQWEVENGDRSNGSQLAMSASASISICCATINSLHKLRTA